MPLALASAGILVSIVGTFAVKVKDGGSPQKALNMGEFGSSILMVFVSLAVILFMLPDSWTFNGHTYKAIGVFWATIAGLSAGLGIGKMTEY